MTNEEKFIEVFGLEPDIGNCPVSDNMYCDNCPYVDQCFRDCFRSKFWDCEYKEVKNESISM